MIETLLLALKLTDADIYNKIDIYSRINEQLTETSIPFDIAIISPSFFNATKQSVLPVFSVWKVNNVDNKGFLPPGAAYLVITQTETNQHEIVQLSNENGKLPLPSNSALPAYPPGYDKNKKTTRYNKLWRDLTKRDIQWVDGNYSMFVLCGKMVSNRIDLKVSGTSNNPENIDLLNLKKFEATKNLKDAFFEKSSDSPAIPAMHNSITIKAVEHNESNMKSSFIYGSYNLPAKFIKGNLFIEISLVIQQSSESGLLHEKMMIPVTSIQKEDDSFNGFFKYDLSEVLFNQNTDSTETTATLIVNVIAGTVLSNMVEIVKI